MIGGNYQSPWRIKPREARLPAHLRAKVIAKEASRDDAEAAALGWAGPQGRHRERMCLFLSSELGGNNTIAPSLNPAAAAVLTGNVSPAGT